jgi:hypothetical protein
MKYLYFVVYSEDGKEVQKYFTSAHSDDLKFQKELRIYWARQNKKNMVILRVVPKESFEEL